MSSSKRLPVLPPAPLYLSLFLSPQSVFGVQGGVNVSPGILDRWRLVYPKVAHTLPVLDSYDRNAFHATEVSEPSVP